MNLQCRGCQQQLMWGDIIKKLKSKDKEAQKRAGRQPLQPLDPNASAPKTATKAPTQKTVTKTSDTQTKVATKRKKADTENVPSPSLDDHKPKKTSNTKQRSTTTTTTQNTTKPQTSTIPDYFNAYNSDSDIIDMTKLTNSIPSPKISKNSKPKSTTATTTTRTIPIVPTTTTTTTTKPSEPKPMYSSKRKKFEVGELDELYSDDESKPKSTARGKAKASVKNACIDLI